MSAPAPTLLASGLASVSPTLHERFMQKTDRSREAWECWPWLGARSAQGYGRIHVGPRVGIVGPRGGREYRVVGYAHRVAYWLFIGPIPDDRHIDHMCWNTSCVNPHHLRAATRSQNRLNLTPASRREVAA